MTEQQVLIIATLGGILGVAGTAFFILVCVGVFFGAARLIRALAARRERYRALKDGRRRLNAFTTIDDLKE